ncbi:MAG TPA: hypothetical protein VFM25_10755 [Verrucomicrobiae bacterium]|jgi:hypothetical protein|nr:hypothetical protein [Verrucomicrobiae bacterium]
MDTAAERIFGFVREATRKHIRMDLQPRSDKAQNQKDLSPKGFIKNQAATALLLSRSPRKKGYSPSCALSAPGF